MIVRLSEQLCSLVALHAPVASVVGAAESWLAKYGPVQRTQLGDWSGFVAYFSPLRGFPTRYVCLPVNEHWAVIVHNRPNSPPALLHPLSKVLATDGMRAQWGDDGCIWDVASHGKTVRGIACHLEGKWRFGTRGEPLPFEDLARYEQPSTRERFPPELLLRYLSAATGASFPLDWVQRIDTADAMGLERSTKDVQGEIEQHALEDDLGASRS